MVERRKSNHQNGQPNGGGGVGGPRLNMELEALDIGSIDLDIFMIAKRNTRMATFVRLSQRFVANNLQALPQINPAVFRATL